tara:strand:+ start:687 stop:974 length:288 start_codon:yes stop_codon:yes gene_type:complete
MSNDIIEKDKVISPCISICKTDPRTGFCYGCGRTDQEKIIWKDEKTTILWKKENLNFLIERMSGWQLETFKESYSNKIKTGLSLFKEKLLEDKKT